ncbi:MAG: hypothetical protein ACRDIU_02390, partial [Actinomycetota bacterium]
DLLSDLQNKGEGSNDSGAVSSSLAQMKWGALIAGLDLRINGFDLLLDPLGWLMVLGGLVRVSGQPGPPMFKRSLQLVSFLIFVQALWSISTVFVPPEPSPQGFFVNVEPAGFIGLFSLVVGLLTFSAAIVFCRAMLGFCEFHRLQESAKSWGLTLLLITAGWGSVEALGLILEASRRVSPDTLINLFSPATILAFLVVGGILGVGPFVHLCVSMLRMRKEVKSPPWKIRPESVF